ncbi:hypothetical protein ROZALSC1DRAFT_27583 [Rozella allomycis CSF55]|uniref:W2 domain-containing protein n=1 Tax=Rozella allomycis (strain CSF55) TaxID=988480 RepID=A0A075ASY7_ROZAC|nr:W2 domain-containing protein [Rozella allomycis CSF55]RKP20972.1 hypothetical protein ROZALSC1DRAFT_27583 [Rozella allomycis CSF55]|eukprot:EPZ31598.1 W2 domain-containing protein [Rozella allomycis CSF55]
MAEINLIRNNDAFYRYKMPRLQAKVEGRGNGIKTVILNMAEIAKAVYRPPSYITKFFGDVLGTQSKIDDKNNRYVVNGKHETIKLQDLVYDFIEKFVLCQSGSCNNPETEIIIQGSGKNKTAVRKCAACGYTTPFDPVNKLTNYIIKNPPSPAIVPATTGATKQHADAEEGEQEEHEQVVPEPEEQELDVEVELKEEKKQLYAFGEEIAAHPEWSAEEIKRMAAERDIEEHRIIIVVMENCFTENILAEIPKKIDFLREFLKRPSCQRGLIGGVERFVGIRYPELLSKTALILKTLYDEDLLQEEPVLEWAKRLNKKYVSKDTCRAVHKAAKQFVRWLQNADEESEEEESDE